MQADYDDYDELEQGGLNWMLVTVLLLAVGGFFALAYYAYQTGTQPAAPGDVIVIQADPSPIKVAPEEPGGAEFPHQDKTIYEAIDDGGDEVSVTVLPETEEPDWASIEALKEEVKQGGEAADKKIAEIIQQAVQQTQEELGVEPKPEPKIEKPAPVITTNPFAPVMETEETKQVSVKAEEVLATGGVRVQLGAFRDRVEAEKNWQKISRAHSSILSGKPHQVVKADLGDRGIFYRLRVAGFNDEDAAKAACKSLSAKGQGCFLVQ